MRMSPFLSCLGLLSIMAVAAVNVEAEANREAAPPAGVPAAKAAVPLDWHDLATFPVEDRGWSAVQHPYDRLPLKAKGVVRQAVWDLSRCGSGLSIRFVTDAREISARWTLCDPRWPVSLMAATGTGGLDLYAKDGERWRWVGLARPEALDQNLQRIIMNIPPGLHEYRMYLPLYSAISSVAIGVNAGAVFRPADGPPPEARPLVFYGTSITHGASASRPGMTYPAILGRRLGVPSINLGFSSNGTMDIEVANLMTEIDAAAYVIDCLPNMDDKMVAARTVPLVECLRKARPNTPILLVENSTQQNAWFLPTVAASIEARNQALQKAYRQLRASHVKGLYYVPGKDLLGPDSAVDGIHPSDWGLTLYANAIEPVLRRALKRSGTSIPGDRGPAD